MINPSDPYIQYITKSGQIKTVTTSRSVNLELGRIQYVVSGIIEPFFLLNLFDNNEKVNGIWFDNVDNLQMMGFLNSDFQSVEALPENAFFNEFETVAMLRKLEVPPVIGDGPGVVFPEVQNVEVVNKLQPFWDNVQNTNVQPYESDPDDLKYLKFFIALNFSTVQQQTVWIDPIMIYKGLGQNYVCDARAFLFGTVKGNVAVSDVKYGQVANQYYYPALLGGNVEFPYTMTKIENLEGSEGFCFKGYIVYF